MDRETIIPAAYRTRPATIDAAPAQRNAAPGKFIFDTDGARIFGVAIVAGVAAEFSWG